MNLSQESFAALEELIHANIDNQKQFEEAATVIEDAEMRRLFREVALELGASAYALQRYLASQDHAGSQEMHVGDRGTLKGAFHRWWFDIRSSIQEHDTHTVLCEAKRCEDEMLKSYERVLAQIPGHPMSDPPSDPLSALVRTQLRVVQQRHDQIRELRDRNAH